MATASLFDRIDQECRRDRRLRIDLGDIHPSFGQRSIRASELNAALSSAGVSHGARDAVLSNLCRRVRRGDGRWVIVILTALSPALRTCVGQLHKKAYSVSVEELEALVVSGVTDAVHAMSLGRGRIAARLVWAGFRAGLAGQITEAGCPETVGSVSESQLPSLPWGHPDLVLAAAVRARVLTSTDAAVIGANRLEGISVEELAQHYGVDRFAIYRRRRRAELRLVRWLSGCDVNAADQGR